MTAADLPTEFVPEKTSLVVLQPPAGHRLPSGRRIALQIEASAFAFCLVGLPLLPLLVAEGALALILFGTLAAHGARLAQGRPVPIPIPAVVAVVAFLGWAGLTLLWSERPDRALVWLGQIMLVLPSAILLYALAASATRDTARAAGWALAVGVTGTAGFVLVDLVTSGMLRGFLAEGAQVHRPDLTPPMIVVALLCWPAASLLYRQGARMMAAVVVAIPAFPLLLGASDTAALVFGTGAVVFLLGCAVAKVVAGAVVLAGLAGILSAPMLVGVLPGLTEEAVATFAPALPPGGFATGFPSRTLWERFDIWSASSRLILEAPLQGWGLGGMRHHAVPEITWLDPDRRLPHPHNGALQAWLDLGVAGAVFLCLGFIAILRVAGRRPVALGAVAALFAGLLAPWSLWTGWWIAAIAGSVAALALVRRVA